MSHLQADRVPDAILAALKGGVAATQLSPRPTLASAALLPPYIISAMRGGSAYITGARASFQSAEKINKNIYVVG